MIKHLSAISVLSMSMIVGLVIAVMIARSIVAYVMKMKYI